MMLSSGNLEELLQMTEKNVFLNDLNFYKIVNLKSFRVYRKVKMWINNFQTVFIYSY